jgi:hypothetical protein
MQRGDLEVLALTMLKEVGMTPLDPVCVVKLVQRLVGKEALRFAPEHVLPGNGSLVRVGSEWRIYLRRSAPTHIKRFVALHEVGHFVLGPDASEEECNQLAAAVLLPRLGFLRERIERRRHISTIARSFGSDETCAWLRLSEVTGERVAVVSPRSVHSRGRDKDRWLEPDKLRELATCPTPKGVWKAKLHDDPTRMVLRAG